MTLTLLGHKHKKHKCSTKKQAKKELRRLRRAERRTQPVDFADEPDGVLASLFDEENAARAANNRSKTREEKKLARKKAREITVSRFRQIALSDSEAEDEAADGQSTSSLPEREEPKISSKAGRSLRKQVKKLSAVFDSTLSLEPEADQDSSPK